MLYSSLSNLRITIKPCTSRLLPLHKPFTLQRASTCSYKTLSNNNLTTLTYLVCLLFSFFSCLSFPSCSHFFSHEHFLSLFLLVSHSPRSFSLLPRPKRLLRFSFDLGYGLREEHVVGLRQQEGEQAGAHGSAAEENEGKGVVDLTLGNGGEKGSA